MLSLYVSLAPFYDKQYCVQKINKEKIEEFNSVIGELPNNFTLEFSAFARTVIPNNGIKTPKSPSEALNFIFWKR